MKKAGFIEVTSPISGDIAVLDPNARNSGYGHAVIVHNNGKYSSITATAAKGIIFENKGEGILGDNYPLKNNVKYFRYVGN